MSAILSLYAAKAIESHDADVGRFSFILNPPAEAACGRLSRNWIGGSSKNCGHFTATASPFDLPASGMTMPAVGSGRPVAPLRRDARPQKAL
jgi:hypothetical protein